MPFPGQPSPVDEEQANVYPPPHRPNAYGATGSRTDRFAPQSVRCDGCQKGHTEEQTPLRRTDMGVFLQVSRLIVICRGTFCP
ncbi:hypothetical protein Ate02nite_61720 [Paractinoplanes tereljensis]|uniref:Uncharacterized protein n=1 Tax=Paractinoplanes tereljensis TaxID=571912 RepID=A0A919NTW0_9ACTN|nr:hypothetical protein Ate02nite_61720 [Actinoplanes tereljensis]